MVTQTGSEAPMIVRKNTDDSKITMFLCGDVMTGRGIDQIMQHSVDPVLYEPYVQDAYAYVRLAETKNGPIEQPVSASYIWGDALNVWHRLNPAVKIINLETAVTTSTEPWPGKGIHYRMHPGNINVFTAAGIDVCTLANNHILDWGYMGLAETLQSLEKAHIAHAGAGPILKAAQKPAIVEIGRQRLLVFAAGAMTSGIPPQWASNSGNAGIHMLNGMGETTIRRLKERVNDYRRPHDIVVFSIHWGDNWGYDIPDRQRTFAHRLIDQAGVDIVFGHSSHHPKGIEVYKNKLILYGCGDFINDYEGIGGHEQYRGDLTLMYFPTVDDLNGDLQALRIVPMQIENLRLNRASHSDARWLRDMLNREGKVLGTYVEMNENREFMLRWD